MKGVGMEGLFVARCRDGNWALLVKISDWVLLVRVVDPGFIASRRYQVFVDGTSLVIRAVIFAT
jgi:hypothetical protein